MNSLYLSHAIRLQIHHTQSASPNPSAKQTIPASSQPLFGFPSYIQQWDSHPLPLILHPIDTIVKGYILILYPFGTIPSDNSISGIISSSYIHFISGMLGGKYYLLLAYACMSIDLSRSDRTVAGHLLDIADIYVLLKQQGSKCMTKHMRSNMLRYLSFTRIIMSRTDCSESGLWMRLRKKKSLSLACVILTY